MYIPEISGYFKSSDGHDRMNLPRNMVRVSGGQGGDAFLLIGSEKVAMYDCGMACFSDRMLSNVHEVLDPLGRTVDCIFLSHTHYDHIGALPYVLDEFPDIVVYGSSFCEKVFKSETAILKMEELGKFAQNLYNYYSVYITARGMRLDNPLYDGDTVDLGDMTVTAYETPGHTMCSICYGLSYKDGLGCTTETNHLEGSVLLMNETVGIYDGNGTIESSPLKGYEMTFEAAKRLKALNYPTLMCLHYGVIDPYFVPHYFDTYIATSHEEKKFFDDLILQGKTDDETFEAYTALKYSDGREYEQPFNAYKTNTYILIANERKEIENLPAK